MWLATTILASHKTFVLQIVLFINFTLNHNCVALMTVTLHGLGKF